jgi:hypothetical protein
MQSTDSAFTTSDLSKWEQPNFWLKLCPSLTIGTDLTIPSSTRDTTATSVHKDRRRQLQEKGFTVIDEPLAEESMIKELRDGLATLHKLKFPASFILLFDVTWKLAALSRDQLEQSTLACNKFQFDILAWHIDSDGFSPHRDRQPENAAASFHNEEARFVTQWIALTDATPENSCLHMIPKYCDPGYAAGDTEDEDPLHRALSNKESFQQIRAVPRRPGQSVLFTHRTIHWGSARDPDSSQPPRIAISFVCSDPAFESSYVDPKHFTSEKAPPFHIRLLLVCAQLLIYYQRFDLSKECIKACYSYCKEHESELDECYRRKVFVEFVKAMNETSSKETTATVKDSDAEKIVDGDAKDESEAEEDEEAMMEEMLDAEQGGYGEFSDDFDELDGEDDDGGGDDNSSESDDNGATLFGKRSAPEGNTDINPSKRVNN